MLHFTIEGLQEAQQDNLKQQAAVKPSGGLGRAVQQVAFDAHRYEVAQTHVLTGALRASQRVEVIGSARWIIYIDESAKNPLSGNRVSGYAETENARGGSHAFIDNTMSQAEAFVNRAEHLILSEF